MSVSAKGGLLRLFEMIKGAPVTRRAIRFYEDQGLLLPAGRDHLGRRVYTRSDLLRLRLIRELRGSGLPLSVVRDVLDARMIRPDDESRGKWIDRLLNVLSRQTEELHQQLQAAEQAERSLRGALHWIKAHRATIKDRPEQVLSDPSVPLIVQALLSQPDNLSTKSPVRPPPVQAEFPNRAAPLMW